MAEIPVNQAPLTTKQRNTLPKSKFAYVDKAGQGHYPIHDEAHVRNALARAAGQLKAGGKGAAIARLALPKIKAAAKRMGIKTDQACKGKRKRMAVNQSDAGAELPANLLSEAAADLAAPRTKQLSWGHNISSASEYGDPPDGVEEDWIIVSINVRYAMPPRVPAPAPPAE